MILLSWFVYVAAIAMSESGSVQEPDPLIGAWGGPGFREGRDAEMVVIFTETYQVAAWFDAETGELVHTNGGLWSRSGAHVTEIVQFDSHNPQRVGTSVSFDIELSDTGLSIVGDDKILTRIDRGDGNRLEGGWQLVGPLVVKSARTIRLMSTTRFEEVVYEPDSGRLISAIGGSYTLDSERYVETVDFAFPDRGKPGPEMRYSAERHAGGWRQTSDGKRREWRKREAPPTEVRGQSKGTE